MWRSISFRYRQWESGLLFLQPALDSVASRSGREPSGSSRSARVACQAACGASPSWRPKTEEADAGRANGSCARPPSISVCCMRACLSPTVWCGSPALRLFPKRVPKRPSRLSRNAGHGCATAVGEMLPGTAAATFVEWVWRDQSGPTGGPPYRRQMETGVFLFESLRDASLDSASTWAPASFVVAGTKGVPQPQGSQWLRATG